MQVKYALFSGSCLCLTTVQYLLQKKQLSCVVLPESDMTPDLYQLQQLLNNHNIPTLQFKANSHSELIADLDRLGANCGLVYLFKNKLGVELIEYFTANIFNVHASALPNYRGPMPVFWQLRKGAESLQVSFHQVVEKIDAGPVYTKIDLPIHPFDTAQCLHQRIAQTIPMLLEQYQNLEENIIDDLRVQSNKDSPSLFYARQIVFEDLMIKWQHHTSEEIVNLARAANGDLGGARFKHRDGLFQLIQATTMGCDLSGVKPGTVIELDRKNGLIVKTQDSAIRFDIVITEQGIFDGYRFAVLFGLDPGLEVSGTVGDRV